MFSVHLKKTEKKLLTPLNMFFPEDEQDRREMLEESGMTGEYWTGKDILKAIGVFTLIGAGTIVLISAVNNKDKVQAVLDQTNIPKAELVQK